MNSDLDFLFNQTPARAPKIEEKPSEAVNPMLLDSGMAVEATPAKDLKPIKEEVDASITSSGLLAKHNANIARLA